MMNLPVPCPHYPHYLPVQIFTRSEKKIFARSYCGLWRGLNILLMLLEGTRNLIRYINKTYIALEEDHLLIVLSRFASNSLFTTLASCLPTLASRWTRPVGSVKQAQDQAGYCKKSERVIGVVIVSPPRGLCQEN